MFLFFPEAESETEGANQPDTRVSAQVSRRIPSSFGMVYA
jgi:hypothetical protein